MNKLQNAVVNISPSRLAGWSSRRGSIRTQLIAGNILALALLLGLLGGIIHFAVRSFMMGSVNQELDAQVQRLLDRPPPPPPRRDGSDVRDPRPPRRDAPQNQGEFPPEMRGGPNDPNHPFNPFNPSHSSDRPAEDRAGQMRQNSNRQPTTGNRQPFDLGMGRFHGPGGGPGHGPPPDSGAYHVYMYDRDGKSIDHRNPHALLDVNAFKLTMQGAAKQENEPYSTVTTDGETTRVLTRPLIEKDGSIVGVIQGYRSLTEVNQALEDLDRALLALIPVGLLGAGMAGANMTDRVLRRVRGLTQVAGHLSARNLSDRLPVTGNDEFSELADTFNGLLGRLETAFTEQQRVLEQQRRFTADASHELKTPLTIIKGNTSMALDEQPANLEYRQTLQEIDRAADTMSSLVQDLLLLARSDGGQLGKDRIELLVREVLERAASAVAHHKGAHITLQIEDDALSVLGNEGELVRLFTNLLDNATRYTPSDGRITLQARRQDNRVVIAITDTGTGIAPEHLPHLGERFYRVDSSRSRPTGGTGLGLSICKSIVEAHNGSIGFQSRIGVGTTVTITLPAQAS